MSFSAWPPEPLTVPQGSETSGHSKFKASRAGVRGRLREELNRIQTPWQIKGEASWESKSDLFLLGHKACLCWYL